MLGMNVLTSISQGTQLEMATVPVMIQKRGKHFEIMMSFHIKRRLWYVSRYLRMVRENRSKIQNAEI